MFAMPGLHRARTSRSTSETDFATPAYRLGMGKKYILALDDSPHSRLATEWTGRNVPLHDNDDTLHLVTVLPPLTYAVTPAAPVATAAALVTVRHQWEAQRRHEEAHASEIVKWATSTLQTLQIPGHKVHSHILTPAGGASGVAESIVEFARQHEATATIVGCRGMGAFKRSLMSMVGLGSVSDYLVHHVQSPVMVVRHPHNEPLPGMDTAVEKPSAPMQSRTVLVSLDDSAHSRSALQFTLDNLMNSRDRLHLVSVALPVPFPMVDESSAAIAALETRQWEETKRNSAARAEQVCKAASEQALAAGVLPQQLFWQYLLPQGGASDVAGSICRYAKDNDVQLVVLGSRGLGSFKRSVMSIMGLGSVSDYCVHHLENPVLIYKAPIEASPQNHPPNTEDTLEPQPPTS